MIKAKNRILSTILAGVLAVGSLAMGAPMEVEAAITTTLGQANDGVDFSETTGLLKPGTGLYLGKYKHANALGSNWTDNGVDSYYGTPTHDADPTPILWEVMGEEVIGNTADGKLTLLSKYAIDSKPFHGSENSWKNSTIKAWLNNKTAGGFLEPDNFLASENSTNIIPETNIYTRLYKYNNGDPIEKNSAWGGETYDANGTNLGTTQQIYLPWGTYESKADSTAWVDGNHGKVGWDVSADKTSANILTNNKTQLKAQAATSSLDGVDMWLRSPYSFNSDYGLFSAAGGSVNIVYVSNTLGVRPALKLNPESVIFTSEVLADTEGKPYATAADSNYAASAAGANFKLTVLDITLSAGTVTADGDNVDVSAHPTKMTTPGGSIAVTANSATANTNLTYKIVQDVSGERKIVGYGQSTNNTTLTVNAKDLTDANLAEGDYTVYVWLQKNNAINSHEGSLPLYFTMKVDATAPTVSSVLPTATTNVTTGGSLAITFSEPMNTTTGTVTLTNGGTVDVASVAWSNSNKTYTIPYSGLAWGTAYAVHISGFKDAAGNEMVAIADDTHKFTTMPQPTGPYVSPTTLTLDLNGVKTGTIAVNLGVAGNRAAKAKVTNNNPNDIGLSETGDFNLDKTITITGLQVATNAAITIEFSGGDLASTQTTHVNARVMDSTAPPQTVHVVSFYSDGVVYQTKNVGDGGSLGSDFPANPTKTGYTFGGWFAAQNGTGTQVTNTTVFDASADVYAKWTQNSGGSGNSGNSSSSSSGGRSTTPTTPKTPDELIEQAVKDKKAEVTITLGSTETSASISEKQIKALVDNNMKLIITKGSLTMEISPKAIKAALSAAGISENAKVDISIAPASQATLDEIAKNFGDDKSALNKELLKLVYDITIKANGVAITSFPTPLKMIFDLSKIKINDKNWNPTADEMSKLSIVRYLTDNSKQNLGDLFNSTTKKLTTTTSSLSKYGVMLASDLQKISMKIGEKAYSVGNVSKTADVAPIIQDGRTLVPIRFIAEAYGAEVAWSGETSSAQIVLDGKTLHITIGQKANGMDVPAQLIDGRTMVPLRYIAENFGANVIWEESTRAIRMYK